MQNNDDGVDALEKLLKGVMEAPIKAGNEYLLGELSSEIEAKIKPVKSSLYSILDEAKKSKDLIEEYKDLADHNYSELSEKIAKVNSGVEDALNAVEKHCEKIESGIAVHYADLVDKLQSENGQVVETVATAIENITSVMQKNNAQFLAEFGKTADELKSVRADAAIFSDAIKGQLTLIQDSYSALMINMNNVESSIRDAAAIASKQSEKIEGEIEIINTTIPNIVSTTSANLATELKTEHGVVLKQIQQAASKITWQIVLSVLNLAGLIGLIAYLTTR